MAPTRKTSPLAKPTRAESETVADVAPGTEAQPAPHAVDDTRAETTAAEGRNADVPEGRNADVPEAQPTGDETGPDEAPTENSSEPPEEEAPAAQPSSSVPVPPVQGPPPPPLSATQLQNDPLLGTHDDIVVDLGRKLRWAAIGYALLGLVASWLIAAQVGVAMKSGAPFGWALAATILIGAAAVWYLADVSTRFTSVAAYRKAKTPQAIARLERGSVVGLYTTIGAWIGAALGALVVVSGTVSAVLTLAFRAGGWVWFFGAVPVVLLYLFCFGLLHYRLLEKTRDAVA